MHNNTCILCGCVLKEDSTYAFQDRPYCRDCLEEATVLCSHCGRRILRDEDEGSGDLSLCSSCYMRFYTHCSHCGRLLLEEDLSPMEKRRILSILGTACEARGVDATGYSYTSRGKLFIEKKAVPARRMDFTVPADARVIMGHTRMTTQGSAARQRNNHPFLGILPHNQFALAHNGVLTNDRELRRQEHLPRTNIETDSYVAVQLIEKQKALDFGTLRTMAETVNSIP